MEYYYLVDNSSRIFDIKFKKNLFNKIEYKIELNNLDNLKQYHNSVVDYKKVHYLFEFAFDEILFSSDILLKNQVLDEVI